MEAGKYSPSALRVLVVDDDRITLVLLKRLLNLCNYDNVTTVMDASTALEMLRERKDRDDQFDLVIGDVFMVDGINGFKLLELIGLEMEIPVIMLSAKNEMEIMMKGIKNGACDYLVKQVRNIWMHVARKNRADPRNKISNDSDNAGQKLQSGDGKNGDKDGANQTKTHSKKNKKDEAGAEKDREEKSQKKQRIEWCAELHKKFVEAIDQIGIERAVPKKILEVMNVDGLSRDNVASHLQKHRLYLKKLNDGTLKNWSPFTNGQQAWLSGRTSANSHMSVAERSHHHQKLGRNEPSPSFAGASSSNNPFVRTNSQSAFGTHSAFPTRSIQIMCSQENMGIPLREGMEPVVRGVNLHDDTVPVPVPLQEASRFISSGNTYAMASSGELSGASQCLPPGPSGTSSTNLSNAMVLNASRPISCGTSGSSVANITNGDPPLGMSMCFPLSYSCASYASVLRAKILGASRSIPFDADDFFNKVVDGEMLAPSPHLPLQSPWLVNHALVQIEPSSSSLFNQVSSQFIQVPREPHQFAGLGNSSSSTLGSSSSIRHKFSNLQIGNSVMPAQRPSGGGAVGNITEGGTFDQQAVGDQANNGNEPPVSTREMQIGNYVIPAQMPNGVCAIGNLPEGGTFDHHAVGDQVNNCSELPTGTSEADNGVNVALEEFFADRANQDFLDNYDDSFYGNL
ncbi:hypothetical protein BS78_10G208000 [Paspalum vaginatum]|nr:hypothetical protein BS78_10G208000 [Paspalum vaginatum]KAJ1260124.1 hypothetical protein BS78_10G208000 [Paspalum vaginatum]